MLAQIARDGLVRDLAARLTADFARNLDRHLSGAPVNGAADNSQNLNGVSLLIDLLRRRAQKAIRRMLGR
jgi:carbon-monoxide dehydrogenase small subunit